jgi:hypothetical protein
MACALPAEVAGRRRTSAAPTSRTASTPSSTQKHLNQLCILKANTVDVLNSRAFAAVVSHGLRLPGCWQEARQERRHLPGHVPEALCEHSVVPFAKQLPAQKVSVTGKSDMLFFSHR